MLLQISDLFSEFMESGGQVLWVIFAVTLGLWILILERYMFMKWSFPKKAGDTIQFWLQRKDHSSWKAHRIREQALSESKQSLRQFLPLIKTLVALCPLLGLLGTVTGMIAVFDVMAITGTGNARSMASGISMATVPTMAGMVAALSGIYSTNFLDDKAKIELEQLTDKLLLK